MTFRDAVFIITEEKRCPLYNVGEKLVIEDSALTVPEAKSTCLILAEKILGITKDGGAGYEQFSSKGVKKSRFECGGCSGLIRFEFKREKEFATLQMKLLAVDRKRRQAENWKKYIDLLRSVKIFGSLGEDKLWDLTTMLKLRKYAPDEMIVRRGDPGTHLYILLSGRAAVVNKTGNALSEMNEGDIFGEMSLLSGEPVTKTVKSLTDINLALLSSKNFKHTLNKYPVLQVFFYRLLVDRVEQTHTDHSTTISSGMTGSLSDIVPVELFQMINNSQKTGRIELFFKEGNAFFSFNEGELVLAHYGKLRGKEAFFAVLGKSEGEFSYTSGLSPKEEVLPIIAGFMVLIMDGMKRLDEMEEPA